MKRFADSFREELVTTGLLLAVSVGGSFFLLGRMLERQDKTSGAMIDEAVLGSIDQKLAEEANKESGLIELGAEQKETPSPSLPPTSTPTPKPTKTPTLVEIPYRPAQEFENDDYLISFSRPRLMVGDDKRSFKVDVVMANKNVEGEGLGNRLFATVVKDGEIIVQEAVMSNSKNAVLAKGETISFTASLSLIEGTDVTQLIFVPGDNLPQVTYQVFPL